MRGCLMWSLRVTAPRRCCHFSIPEEGSENLERPWGWACVWSEQTGNPERWEGSQGRPGAVCPSPSQGLCLLAPRGAPFRVTRHFLGVCTLTPAFQLSSLSPATSQWPWSLGSLLFFQASTTPLDCLPRRTIVHENSLRVPANP